MALSPTTPSILPPIETYREALLSIEKAHLDGAAGSQVVADIAAATDALLVGVLQAKLGEHGLDAKSIAERMCLVALGGYGRKEMHPRSDIDVMFLFPKEPDSESEELVSDMLRALFDAHLQIGNVVRDFASVPIIAREDLSSLTAMLEGRLIWGDPRQYERFCRRLARSVQRNRKRLISGKVAERAQRLARYGCTINIQEPDVKESPGGLRDYHHGLWLASFLRGRKLNLAELYRTRLIYDQEYQPLREALEFLWRLRTDLHLLTRKKCDLISMDLQEELATRLKFQDRENRLAEEILMRDYYRAALVIQEFADHMTEQSTYQPIWEKLIRRVRRLELGDGFTLRGTQVDTPRDVHFFENVPQRLLDVFVYAVKSRVALTQSAAAAVHENRNLVDERFRSQEETARKIRMIFRWPGRIVPALRIMRRLGILPRLFPEWRGIENLVRHDLHHRYTVDEHTLLALHHLETLQEDELDFTEERVALWQSLRCRDVLRLATMCHDIGKGRGGDHCEIGARIADEIGARLRFSDQERADVRFLVSQHIMFSQTAQRHDLTDPDIVTGFAERVGTPQRLDLLYLLTHVDLKAMADESLNEWKNYLLSYLYVSARQVLEGKSLPGPGVEPTLDRISEVCQDLAPFFPEETIRRHLTLLPKHYPHYHSTDMIREHLDLIDRFDNQTPMIGFHSHVDKAMLEIVVVARDRVGLFNRMTTAIMLENFSIFGARLNTRDDGIVCNNIIICDLVRDGPVNEIRKELLRERLQHLLVSTAPPPAVPADRSGRRVGRSSFLPQVEIYEEASGRYSVVDVRAIDRAGLLQAISSEISGMGMNISFARVITEGSRVIDVFYVTDRDGKKISDPDRRRLLAERILARL